MRCLPNVTAPLEHILRPANHSQAQAPFRPAPGPERTCFRVPTLPTGHEIARVRASTRLRNSGHPAAPSGRESTCRRASPGSQRPPAGAPPLAPRARLPGGGQLASCPERRRSRCQRRQQLHLGRCSRARRAKGPGAAGAGRAEGRRAAAWTARGGAASHRRRPGARSPGPFPRFPAFTSSSRARTSAT